MRTQVRTQQGFSLVELMIALVLGLVLVGGAVSVLTGTLRSNADLARMARLEEQLDGLMVLVLRDLRRAGGTSKPYLALTGGVSPFGLDAPGALAGETANSCVTFSYDLNRDGLLTTAAGADERFGYRLKQQMMQIRAGGLGCNADGSPGWENAADASELEVTTLSFAIATSSAGDVDTRQVTVTLAGRMKSNPATARSLLRTVRLRNDIYTP
ncbi:MAG: prepilin-type N-terminal cleavage/methylation domain-containing protein [Nevskiales bacterium]